MCKKAFTPWTHFLAKLPVDFEQTVVWLPHLIGLLKLMQDLFRINYLTIRGVNSA